MFLSVVWVEVRLCIWMLCWVRVVSIGLVLWLMLVMLIFSCWLICCMLGRLDNCVLLGLLVILMCRVCVVGSSVNSLVWVLLVMMWLWLMMMMWLVRCLVFFM